MSSVIDDEHAAVVDLPIEQLPMSVISKIRSTLRKHPWMEWMIPAALCAVMLGQLFFSIRQISETADESTHLFAGYRYLKCGDLEFSREHPPLARVVAAAPLLPMNLEVNCSPINGTDAQQALAAHGWLYSRPGWWAVLSHARIAISIFAAGLCFLVWIAARRMFGLATAITATILLIFEPNVLAYGALVLTDMPITFALFFAVFGFYLWVRNRTIPFFLLAGLATGLSLIAKHSGVLVVPILILLAVADAYIQPKNERPRLSIALRNLLAVGLVCVMAVMVVWVGYGFATRPQTPQPQAASANFWLLPRPYLQGFEEALALTKFTSTNLVHRTPWFYVPRTLAIQQTAAFLALIPLAAIGAVVFRRQRRRELLFLLLPACIYLAACMRAGRIGGIRHILPILPFLLIVVAAGCVELAKRSRWVNYAVICLIVLHAASSLHAYPNYLSYANEFWGGPTKAYKYLPANDLGQGYLQARDYLGQHPTDPCWLLTGWQWNPGLYGVPCQTVGYWFGGRIPPHLRGTVIVSSTLLSTADEAQVGAVAPFTKIRPKDSIAGSTLLVFEGDFDTRAAAGMSAWREAVNTGSLDAANEAVALAPESAYAHEARCMLLADKGQPFAALAECDIAITLANDNPIQQAEVQQYEQEIRRAYESPNP